MLLTRRNLLQSSLILLGAVRAQAAAGVATLIGTGTPGLSDREVNNPYGLVFGPDGGLYFCDLDNQRIRRFDLGTKRTITIAGNGQRAYTGDGGPATMAALNMPHEIQFDAQGHLYIAERDNHVIRKVEAGTGTISTLAGTGTPGFSGDDGQPASAQLRQPHSIAVRGDELFICDIGNQRIRRVALRGGVINTYAGTGTPEGPIHGALLDGTPFHGPRTMVFDQAGDLFVALREGNTIYRIDRARRTLYHVAGTGNQGYSGDGGPARQADLAGPKGLAMGPGRTLYVADTENHVIRKVDLATGIITTVLGTGQRGDGPETDPLQCRLARPHALVTDAAGALYVADSEAHRIRVLTAS